MIRRSSFFPALIAIALLLSLTVSRTVARVSWRWGTASQSNKAMTSAGGTSAYKAELNINGADADLSVFSFEGDADRVVARLRTLFADSSFAYNGGTMAFGFLQDGNTVLRFVLLQLTAESTTLVIKIEQSVADYEKSLKPPDKHLLKGLPEFPGSTPLFYARNHDTDLQLATASTPAIARNVNAFYSDTLTADDWKEPIQEASSLQFFIKGPAVSMVLVSEPSKSGTSNITLLHKIHGVK